MACAKLATKNVILYTMMGSSCGRRVELALQLKGVQYQRELVKDLDNPTEDFVKLNPLKQFPVLIIDGHVYRQSLAILEMLEERWPNPSFLPDDPLQRAKAREIANTVVSSIQPLQNGCGPLPRFLEKMSGMTVLEWKIFWVDRGFTVLEDTLSQSAGKFCVGDSISLADICLVPQYINARDLFQMDLSKYHKLKSVAEYCLTMEPFKSVCTE